MCSLVKSKHVVIRKQRSCWGCLRISPKGSMMLCCTTVEMGKIYNCYWCDSCQKLTEYGECYTEGEFEDCHEPTNAVSK